MSCERCYRKANNGIIICFSCARILEKFVNEYQIKFGDDANESKS